MDNYLIKHYKDYIIQELNQRLANGDLDSILGVSVKSERILPGECCFRRFHYWRLNPNLKRYVQPSDEALDREEWLEKLGKNQYRNDWNHVSRQAGMNCWIGKLADGTVTTVQTMPWDYRPWGCGTVKKGSCNNGWIQFEICEDNKNDADYFSQVYQEACEITAYLCKLFHIDPLGTADCNGVTVPTILCHQDSYKLGLVMLGFTCGQRENMYDDSSEKDILLCFPK